MRTRYAYLPALAALLVTQLALADSKLYGDSDPGTPFPDKSTVQRDGDVSRMVVLYTYRRMKSGTMYHSGKNDTYYYRSTKVVYDFNCTKKRSKIIQTVFFSDQEGKGNIVHDLSSPGDWTPERDHKNPNSAINIACSSPVAKP